MSIDKLQAITAYKNMILIRRFEEKCSQLYGMGYIGGFCHLYIGQEALAAATKDAKCQGDAVITSYRCHGLALLSGMSPHEVFAELMGKSTGSSKGKGGSMHIFNIKEDFYGGHGIVGAQVPIGTGIAFANKYKGNNNIAITFLGDGAVSQGQVYESFNMASLYNIPVLYVIENNLYGMGTHISRSCAMPDMLYKRGEALGVVGKKIDSMEYSSLYNEMEDAMSYVRQKSRPMLLEVVTYRYRGHSMSDPAKYRTKEEVEEYKSIDSIEQMKNFILKANYATETELKDIDKNIREEIKIASENAIADNQPCEAELYTDILIEDY